MLKNSLLLFVFFLFLFVGSSAQTQDNVKTQIINYDKFKSAINFINIKKTKINVKTEKLAIFYDKTKYPDQSEHIINEKIIFLKKLFNFLNEKIEIIFLPFNNVVEYGNQILKIKEQNIQYIFHIYNDIPNSKNINEALLCLSLLNELTIKNNIINFAPWSEEETLLNNFANFFTISPLDTSKILNNENKIKTTKVVLNKQNKYRNFFQKNSPDIVVYIKDVIDDKIDNSLEPKIYASIFFITSFFDFLVYGENDQVINKNFKILNSFLLGTKKHAFFSEKNFNNKYIKIGSGILDYEESWNIFKNSGFINLKIDHKKENNVLLEKEFFLNSGDNLNVNAIWNLNFIDFNTNPLTKAEIINESLLIASEAFISPLIPLILLEKHINFFKNTNYNFFQKQKESNNIDLVLEYLDNTWKQVDISDSITKNYEEINFKAKFSGKYRIKLIKKTNLELISDVNLNFVHKKNFSKEV
ncbi:hypothetical protein [Mesomycoplasma neurolyticum]|uniref:Uncharacterized protein n=1 Tax=Mesomycoplasma neurolyticum TaxID=2120 RepID=A0A449A616_9BACT|nr:hypothetical protein [Mesomycoplasma neurolyticum]VEU59701.1 Uncharacterised protein [Mesomycoplasma neurolyticum]